MRPQPPQLLASELVSTQVPLQSVVGGGQTLVVQNPLLQASPFGQARPQPPQLLGSLWVSTQPVLQLVRPDRPSAVR